MHRFASGILGIQQGSHLMFSDFRDDGVMWSGDGPRKVSHHIVFDEAFRAPPVVQVGLSMWDLDRQTNPRADISAQDVTETGFSLVFRTWGDTRIARVRADWLAVGALPFEDDWNVS